MREPTENGNGHKCDRCGKYLQPGTQIMIKGFDYKTGDEHPSGRTIAIGTRDVCPKCFYDIFSVSFPYYEKREDESIKNARCNSSLFNRKKIKDIRIENDMFV